MRLQINSKNRIIAINDLQKIIEESLKTDPKKTKFRLYYWNKKYLHPDDWKRTKKTWGKLFR